MLQNHTFRENTNPKKRNMARGGLVLMLVPNKS